MVQMVRWAVGTHSLPLILITSVEQEKLPAMYKCVHLCNCKFDGLIFMLSLDFKTYYSGIARRGRGWGL